MNDSLRGKIKALEVHTPQGPSGMLLRESQYVFNYETQDRHSEIALAMPLRAASYASSQPHPVFAMNLPEGSLRQRIKERYGKQFAKLDDMAMLSIVGHDQIGRLTLTEPATQASRPKAEIGLKELLRSRASDELFDHLLDTYLASGVSGVQPKVLVPDADNQPGGVVHDGRATARLADLIVKASNPMYPGLTQNEFLCMDAARRAGIEVPEFHLSDDGSLFVLRRFDRSPTGERLGFEDMSVLSGQTYDEYGHYKYNGAYETILLLIEGYCGMNAMDSKQRFFEYFAASCMMRNGDAHMKNFGLLYDSPSDPQSVRLSPMFDVVTTSVYDFVNQRTGQLSQDRELALKFNKSKTYPDRQALIAFGKRCNVRKPEQVLERIDAGMTASLQENRYRLPEQLWQRMKKEWDMSRLSLDTPTKRSGRPSGASSRPAWSPEQQFKVSAFAEIRVHGAGARLTFAEMAHEAIAKAGSPDKVDWRQVEDQAMAKSLIDNRQSAEDVYQAIAEVSPGITTAAHGASLRSRVNVIAERQASGAAGIAPQAANDL